MSFVFYDTETTGIDTAFDQILQFAAVRTDGDLNELDRIELRCRLQPHVIPHPGALRVTRQPIARLLDANTQSHYTMVRQIRDRLLAWSPAIFVGYNSLNFDEHLLRQALFQTLHPPYLTNTGGNCRADAMTLVQAAKAFVPDCLDVPTDPSGKAVYKLDRLAPANGFIHDNAHDALGDVLATIHLAKCVRARAPDVWSRFVRFSQKAAAMDFIQTEGAFVLTEIFFNRPYHYPVASFGGDPDQGNVVLCLDLRNDPNTLAGLSDDLLRSLAARSPKQIRRIRTNAAPLMAALEDVPPEALAGMTIDDLRSRACALQDDSELCRRLTQAVLEVREPTEPSVHVEQQLYDGFIGRDDEARMEQFHEVPWDQRNAVVETFEDVRLQYFGRRLLFQEHPEGLSAEHRMAIASAMANRLVATDKEGGKWTTLPEALEATQGMLAAATEDEASLLGAFELYLRERLATY